MNENLVSAVFDSQSEAERAVTQLRSAGINDSAISIIAQQGGNQHHDRRQRCRSRHRRRRQGRARRWCRHVARHRRARHSRRWPAGRRWRHRRLGHPGRSPDRRRRRRCRGGLLACSATMASMKMTPAITRNASTMAASSSRSTRRVQASTPMRHAKSCTMPVATAAAAPRPLPSLKHSLLKERRHDPSIVAPFLFVRAFDARFAGTA